MAKTIAKSLVAMSIPWFASCTWKESVTTD